MKLPCILLLMLAVAGCNPGKSHTMDLTLAQATDLARRLANEKAQELYKCQPFSDGPSTELVDSRWVWRDRRGQGQVDFEAMVEFAKDGANPTVRVVLLDNRASRMLELRR
jgi:hypothetical protein